LTNQSFGNYATYPSLRDRAVIVTGGASGIGEHIVEHFVRQGARVAFLDVADEPAEQLVSRLSDQASSPPQYLHCDLTDAGAVPWMSS
jgi:D-xylose 1-dehydrogenase